MNESELYINQFQALARLYGEKVFNKISNAHICIIGIGGVGSWTAESLARSGVAQLTIIDMDEVCLTNTNRQIHALTSTVGQSKVTVMKERLLQINNQIKVHAIEDFLTDENLENLMSSNYDIIIDAIDSLKYKTLLNHFCHKNNFPLITVGGAAGKSDPTKIRIADLSESTQDNLLKRLKKKLRREFNLPSSGPMGISAVYSIERAKYPNENGEVCHKKDLKENEKKNTVLDCSTGMGTASFVTGAFGLAAASEAINLLAKEKT